MALAARLRAQGTRRQWGMDVCLPQARQQAPESDRALTSAQKLWHLHQDQDSTENQVRQGPAALIPTLEPMTSWTPPATHLLLYTDRPSTSHQLQHTGPGSVPGRPSCSGRYHNGLRSASWGSGRASLRSVAAPRSDRLSHSPRHSLHQPCQHSLHSTIRHLLCQAPAHSLP